MPVSTSTQPSRPPPQKIDPILCLSIAALVVVGCAVIGLAAAARADSAAAPAPPFALTPAPRGGAEGVVPGA